MKKNYFPLFLILLFSFVCCVGNATVAKSQASTSFTAIFKALEIGDQKTFRGEIKKLLLQGSFEEFMEVMASTTHSGETIFHAFAKVKKNKKGFAEDLRILLQLLSFPMEEKSSPDTADVYLMAFLSVPMSKKSKPTILNISPLALEENPLVQALTSGNFQTAAVEADKLFKGPAIEALSLIHGLSRSGETFYNLVKEAFETHGSEEQWRKIQSVINEFQNELVNLPFQENEEGLKPIEIVSKKKNEHIYKVLDEKRETDASRKNAKYAAGFLTAAGTAWWITGFDAFELVTVVAAGAIGVAVGEKCHDFFKEKLILEKN